MAATGTLICRGRRLNPLSRSYEFLHATFGKYLVAHWVMSELVAGAAPEDLAPGIGRGRHGGV